MGIKATVFMEQLRKALLPNPGQAWADDDDPYITKTEGNRLRLLWAKVTEQEERDQVMTDVLIEPFPDDVWYVQNDDQGALLTAKQMKMEVADVIMTEILTDPQRGGSGDNNAAVQLNGGRNNRVTVIQQQNHHHHKAKAQPDKTKSWIDSNGYQHTVETYTAYDNGE